MRRLRSLLVLTLVLAGSSALAPAASTPARPAYLDPSQSLELRVRDLVSRMTLEEKSAEMMNASPGVPRLGVPRYDWWSEALHGVARSGVATVFPQAIGLAAMWDEPLMQDIGHVIGVEGRAKFNGAGPHAGDRFYGLTFWSPNINIFRDPRWGRGQETYGEDPFLTSRTGVAFVRGLQGDDPRYLLAAGCEKHFAVHSGPESLRHIFDAQPPEADLYETYFPAFEALVREARVEGVMTAYNALYGKPCAVSPLLFQQLQQWGFNGYVTSDCGAIEDLVRTYKLAKDDAEAQALAVKAGGMVRCGSNPAALADAVRRGLISEKVLDEQLGGLLRTMFRLGFFDPPEQVPFTKITPAENNTPAHGDLARRAANEAIVLLKNDGTLPLDPAKLRRVAVVGPNAASTVVLLGNYNGEPSAPVSALAGIKAVLGAGVEVDYVQGCDYASTPGGVHPIPRTGLEAQTNTGLIGEYFDNPNLAGKPVAERRDRPIVIDFAEHSRPEHVPATGMSVRWQGHLLTALGGEYKLAVTANGGFRLKLGDETVIDAWTPDQKTRSVTRRLPGSATLPITLEYFQGSGPASLSLDWQMPDAASEMQAAVTAAQQADAIIFVGGISAQLEGEEMTVDYEGFNGGDRTAIELPSVQRDLLQKLKATGKPVITVLMSGSALAVPWADENTNAVLEAWYPGQAGGTAIADILFGKVNPSGRLPVTFYRATSDLPPFAEYRMQNRTYRYFTGRPLYAFGHGLSYTRFEYGAARVTTGEGAERTLAVSVDVANVGSRDGDEVVQVYLTPPAAREREALGAFGRVHLKRGEKQTVTLRVPTAALRRWNTEKHEYQVPAGDWKVMIGAASDDIRQTVGVKL
jgi:beta-glucosidase